MSVFEDKEKVLERVLVTLEVNELEEEVTSLERASAPRSPSANVRDFCNPIVSRNLSDFLRMPFSEYDVNF